jgi:hypothetical protein
MKAGRRTREEGWRRERKTRWYGGPSTPIALSCCYMFLPLEDGGPPRPYMYLWVGGAGWGGGEGGGRVFVFAHYS